jgi:hypothetical protein
VTARFQLEDDFLGSVYVNHVWIDDLLSPDDFQRTFYRELFSLAVRDPKMRDVFNVSVWLLSNGREEDACLLGDIGSGVLATTPDGLRAIAHAIRDDRRRRLMLTRAEDLSRAASSGNLEEVRAHHQLLGESLQDASENEDRIRCLSDIPDIMTANLASPEWICEGLIGKHWIAQWVGSPKVGKSIAMTHFAEAVARGGQFLGRSVARTPVLYVDYEMAPEYVRQRRESMGYSANPNLQWWHLSLSERPPAIMADQLLKLVEADKPLVIIDPFRYGHDAKESIPDEMAPIMQRLREIAIRGSGVVIVHHSMKADATRSRGTEAIDGGCDVVIVQEKDSGGFIKISCRRPRYTAPWSITARLDEESLTLVVTDSPSFEIRGELIERITKTIEQYPGLTRNALARKTGIRRDTISRIQERSQPWITKSGPNRATFFFLKPGGTVEQVGQGGSGTHSRVGPVAHTSLEVCHGATSKPIAENIGSKSESDAEPVGENNKAADSLEILFLAQAGGPSETMEKSA